LEETTVCGIGQGTVRTVVHLETCDNIYRVFVSTLLGLKLLFPPSYIHIGKILPPLPPRESWGMMVIILPDFHIVIVLAVELTGLPSLPPALAAAITLSTSFVELGTPPPLPSEGKTAKPDPPPRLSVPPTYLVSSSSSDWEGESWSVAIRGMRSNWGICMS